MKAFIVVLLVASVASQNLDWTLKDKSLFKTKPTIEELLLKERLGGHMMDFDTLKTSNIFDTMHTTNYGRRVSEVSVLSLEELLSTSLFREYMELPLFRQFLEQHPIVFKRYVESPLFQKFWMIPQFQMYFRNPIFFYKYIVPQVQYISQTVVPTTEGIYNDYENTPYTTKYTPYSYRVPEYSSKWSVPMSKSFNFPYTTPTTSTTNYRYLLEKMMSHMNVNKPRVSETVTDIKMLPSGQIKEQTFGKWVDPITGMEKITVGDVKSVDEKIMPVETMNFPYGMETLNKHYGMNNVNVFNTESVKDALLKHMILNKVLGHKRITPEVYETLFGDDKEIMTPEIYSSIYKHKQLAIPEILETVFGNKKVITPEIYETLFGNKKVITPETLETIFGNRNVITPEVNEILFGEDKKVMTPETLETIFGKKVYSPEVYSIFGERVPETYNTVNFEPLTMKNKMMSPFVYRMLKNKNVVSPFLTNKMDSLKTIEKFETEKMIDEIQKEKLIKDLPLFTKEHSKLFNIESEIPRTVETSKVLKHIPLRFGKPVVGSNIEEFTLEKELF